MTAHERPMCNLYKMRASVDEIARLFGALANPGVNLPAFDEIYPNREAPILRLEGEGGNALSLETMGWGVPGFGTIKRPITNVRNLDSNFWRNMIANPQRRCLVPVTSFCEWTGEKGSKTKVWFGLREAPLFAFAGLWRPVRPDENGGEPGARMAFLTCAANDTVGAIHPKAMPVILTPEEHATWLTGDDDAVRALARPFPDDAMDIVEPE